MRLLIVEYRTTTKIERKNLMIFGLGDEVCRGVTA